MNGYSKKATSKIGKVMGEFAKGSLHAGKTGKIVKKPAQAKAIALSEARKRGFKVPPKKTGGAMSARNFAPKMGSRLSAVTKRLAGKSF
jgi:hypothetical protein